MIALIDLKMGNVGSVSKALDFLGYESVTTADPNEIAKATHIVFPGVGSFAHAAKKLVDSGLREEIRKQVIEHHKPILGICLGMQLLADTGEEGGRSEGLGLVAAHIARISRPLEFRIPHVGWNSVLANESSIYSGIPANSCFYFVHSYHMIPAEELDLGLVDYGGPMVASVKKGHIVGTQFHPEKSQQVGLQLLKNFVELIK